MENCTSGTPSQLGPMSKPGFHLIIGKVTRQELATALICWWLLDSGYR